MKKIILYAKKYELVFSVFLLLSIAWILGLKIFSFMSIEETLSFVTFKELIRETTYSFIGTLILWIFFSQRPLLISAILLSKLFRRDYLNKKLTEYREADCNLFVLTLRFVYYYLVFGKKIIAHQKAIIIGAENIEVLSKGSVLYVGVSYRGFLSGKDKTLLRIRGTLKIDGRVHFDRGSRIDITPTGILEMSDNSTINSFTIIICENRISMGENSGISWNGQIMDTDFHKITYPGRKERNSDIIIGKQVMISCRSSVYKGVHIPDGCVVAADSSIKKDIKTPHTLISPDSSLKEIPGVVWEY